MRKKIILFITLISLLLFNTALPQSEEQFQLRNLIKGEVTEICADYIHVFPGSYKLPEFYETPADNEQIPLPFIKGYIHPVEFEKGEKINIAWEVRNADKVYIEVEGKSDIGEVSSEGSMEVTPLTDKVTTYTIRAVGKDGNTQTHRMQALPDQSIPFDTSNSAMDLQFIDHWNLRYPPEAEELDRGWTLEEQIRAIKQNIDVAKKWGVSEILLFSKKDNFEKMLDYDFEIDGDNLAEEANWTHDPKLRQGLREIIDYANNNDIDLIFHTNEFHIDEDIENVVGDVEAGSEVLWEITEKKLNEFFELYPNIGGLQLTGDETTYNIQNTEQAVRLGKILSKAAGTDRKALLRLWDRIGAIGKPSEEDINSMDEDRDNVWLSFKNTAGDFGWVTDVKFNDAMIGSGDPERQYVEFDAWREYDANNVFPFYYGDVWGERVKKIYEKGVKNLAVRLNWNVNYYNIVENKWSNWVNIYVLRGLAQDPDAEPDSLLKDYINRYYPKEAEEAAFHMYKYSQEFMSTLFYPTKGGDAADHGRLPEADKVGRAGPLGNEYYKQVDKMLVNMLKKIKKLPESVPFKDDLISGAWDAATVAKGVVMRSNGTNSKLYKYGWLYADTKSWVHFRGHLLSSFSDVEESYGNGLTKGIAGVDLILEESKLNIKSGSIIPKAKIPYDTVTIRANVNFKADSIKFEVNDEKFLADKDSFLIHIPKEKFNIGMNSLEVTPYEEGEKYNSLAVDFRVIEDYIYDWHEAEKAKNQNLFTPFGIYEEAGASSDEYIAVKNDESVSTPPSQGHARYEVDDNPDEQLAIWLRVFYDVAAGGNSFWIKYNDNDFEKLNYSESAFEWDWVKWKEQTATGKDTLTIGYGGKGFRLDKILFTNDLNYIPEGKGEEVSIKDEESPIAQKFRLYDNYPNPYNPITTIKYSIPKEGFVKLQVYNIKGQHIKTLVNREQNAGIHRAKFDGSNLSSGIYIYRLISGDKRKSKKMILIK